MEKSTVRDGPKAMGELGRLSRDRLAFGEKNRYQVKRQIWRVERWSGPSLERDRLLRGDSGVVATWTSDPFDSYSCSGGGSRAFSLSCASISMECAMSFASKQALTVREGSASDSLAARLFFECTLENRL
jgi:hypothetical protein